MIFNSIKLISAAEGGLNRRILLRNKAYIKYWQFILEDFSLQFNPHNTTIVHPIAQYGYAAPSH